MDPADLDDGRDIDEPAIRRYRLDRVRQRLEAADLAAIVIADPVNLRYATGSRNMQVWTMHNLCRYAFVAARGPLVLFDLPSSAHLTRGLETVDEIRPSLAFDYIMVGPRSEEMARRWAAEIADLVRRHGGWLALSESWTLVGPMLPATKRGFDGSRSVNSSAAAFAISAAALLTS